MHRDSSHCVKATRASPTPRPAIDSRRRTRWRKGSGVDAADSDGLRDSCWHGKAILTQPPHEQQDGSTQVVSVSARMQGSDLGDVEIGLAIFSSNEATTTVDGKSVQRRAR